MQTRTTDDNEVVGARRNTRSNVDLTSTALHDPTEPSYRRPKQARSHQDSSAGGGGPIPQFSGGIDVQLQCLLDAAPRLQRPSLLSGMPSNLPTSNNSPQQLPLGIGREVRLPTPDDNLEGAPHMRALTRISRFGPALSSSPGLNPFARPFRP